MAPAVRELPSALDKQGNSIHENASFQIMKPQGFHS